VESLIIRRITDPSPEWVQPVLATAFTTIFDEVLVGVIVIDKLEFAKEFEDALEVVDSVITETSVKVCITCPAGATNPLLASSV
tara:strand:- start:478 stop:729 length:252 start_codon:yes stop_codon:yes gene_type:complete